MMLMAEGPGLDVRYVTADPRQYDYSSLLAIPRHLTWCSEYLAVREIDEAVTSLLDLQAIHAELAHPSAHTHPGRESQS